MASKPLSTWIIESVLIIASILIALGLDAWRQTREDEQFVRTALTNFLIEIRQNRNRVDDAAPFNKGLRQVLAQHYAKEDISSIDEFVNMVEIYSPAALQSTAWDTALATGSLAKMEYNLVTALSLTYNLQNRYDVTTRSGMNELTSPQYLFDDNLKLAVYNSIRFLDEVTSMESELDITYGEAALVIQTALKQLNSGERADGISVLSPKDVAHP